MKSKLNTVRKIIEKFNKFQKYRAIEMSESHSSEKYYIKINNKNNNKKN
jgi:predicted HAD superfamily phosphohydrolase